MGVLNLAAGRLWCWQGERLEAGAILILSQNSPFKVGRDLIFIPLSFLCPLPGWNLHQGNCCRLRCGNLTGWSLGHVIFAIIIYLVQVASWLSWYKTLTEVQHHSLFFGDLSHFRGCANMWSGHRLAHPVETRFGVCQADGPAEGVVQHFIVLSHFCRHTERSTHSSGQDGGKGAASKGEGCGYSTSKPIFWFVKRVTKLLIV